MASLIAGERDPMTLADLARGRLRAKTDRLTEAMTGRFTEHHALLLTKMLARSTASPPTSPPCRHPSTRRWASWLRPWPSSTPFPAWGRSPRSDPGRDRHRHEPVPDAGASDLLGALRRRCQ